MKYSRKFVISKLSIIYELIHDLKKFASFIGPVGFTGLQIIGLVSGLLYAVGLASLVPLFFTLLKGESHFINEYLISSWIYPYIPAYVLEHIKTYLSMTVVLIFLVKLISGIVYAGFGNKYVESHTAYYRNKIVDSAGQESSSSDQQRSSLLHLNNQLPFLTSYYWGLVEVSLKFYIILGLLVLLGAVSIKLLLISLLLAFALVALIIPLFILAKKTSLIYFANMKKLQQNINCYIDGLETIKSFGQTEIWKNSIYKINKQFVNAGIRFGITRQAVFTLPEFSIVVIAVMIINSSLIAEASIDTFFAYALLVLKLVSTLGDFNSRFNLLLEVKASSEDICKHVSKYSKDDLIQQKPKTFSFTERLQKLDFNDISIQYQNNKPIISNVSLSASSGDLIQFIGSNGSGKSTLLKSLFGLVDLKSGSISVNDHPLNSIKNPEQILTYHPQDNFLFEGSIRENIAFNRGNITDEKILDVCQKLDIDLNHIFDNGLETHIHENAKNLSGGERQLICIIRTLISEAPVLAFDEFTNHLSQSLCKKVEEVLSNMDEKIIFLISHQNLDLKSKKYSFQDGSLTKIS